MLRRLWESRKAEGFAHQSIPRSILEKIISEPALGYVEMRDTHMLVFNSVATVSVAVREGSYGRYGKKLPNYECNMKCNDGKGRCGGRWRNSVYSTGAKPRAWRSSYEDYLGCFLDDPLQRALPFSVNVSGVLTIDKCINECSQLGFAEAGLQAGTMCHCGKYKGWHQMHEIASHEGRCKIQCPDGSADFCGGVEANSVYRTGRKYEELRRAKKDYVGCVADAITLADYDEALENKQREEVAETNSFAFSNVSNASNLLNISAEEMVHLSDKNSSNSSLSGNSGDRQKLQGSGHMTETKLISSCSVSERME